ncbi:MAG: hydroxyphenylacetyl-CoA thioesterase PaaI [Nocardiopsaceae bacterium]|nr:hydroxyphenylacetyl-CoA thioesterase PaaI [Nocardiopsaceae bacterium]
MFDADASSRSLGIELAEAADGYAVARMRITERMVNGHGIAHGGYLFLLADTAFACACNSYGPATVASGAEITFIASARLGDLLTATATERARYGRNGIYDVTVRRAAGSGPGGDGGPGGEAIAEFRGRSRTIGRGQQAEAGG